MVKTGTKAKSSTFPRVAIDVSIFKKKLVKFLAGFISTAEFSETVVEFCDIRKLNKSNLSFSLTLKIPLKPRVI